MRQKEIYLVPFPFSDLSQTKVRPVLIVSKNSFNKQSDDVIVCAITSQYALHAISLTSKQLASGILFSQSFIKPSSLFKLDKNLLIKKIGVVHDALFQTVKKEIVSLF